MIDDVANDEDRNQLEALVSIVTDEEYCEIITLLQRLKKLKALDIVDTEILIDVEDLLSDTDYPRQSMLTDLRRIYGLNLSPMPLTRHSAELVAILAEVKEIERQANQNNTYSRFLVFSPVPGEALS